MNLRTRNDDMLASLTPYLVALPGHAARLGRAPFGLAVDEAHLVDPTRRKSAPFLDILHNLDGLTFGPEGMPMPKWVFYNGAELPGGIFGFGRPARDLPAEVPQQLGAPDGYDGLVPLSMYIAIPVRPPAVWFGHNLASLNPIFPDLGLRGLASITKAVALKCFGCEVQIGATQWDSSALPIHCRFGPLDLITAYTPAHSEAETLTYRFAVTDDKLRAAAGDKDVTLDVPTPDFQVHASDIGAMKTLQARIEAGERFVIAGRPTGRDKDLTTPIAQVR